MNLTPRKNFTEIDSFETLKKNSLIFNPGDPFFHCFLIFRTSIQPSDPEWNQCEA